MTPWKQWWKAVLTVEAAAGSLDRRYDEDEAMRLRLVLSRHLAVITDEISATDEPTVWIAHAILRSFCPSLEVALDRALHSRNSRKEGAVVALVKELRRLVGEYYATMDRT